ncbi:MAG: sodium:proton antiporter NhaD [Candidatus Sericytochromatia bacterium]|nr:sodium:proton antiporter NhaD [Candidatus Tanganyikabacteria bacterium]
MLLLASPAALSDHPAGIAAIAVFLLAYLLVMGEERLHLRKSLPVMVAAGIMWLLVAAAFGSVGKLQDAEAIFRHNLLDFAELFLFLLAAMTFINTMSERGVFEALRAWLISRKLSLRALFWVTGALAFFISPIADNLTTALVMGAVALAVGEGKPRFIALSCINIVVAANAGGAFSPFGDITTLMVWQKGIVKFFEFFALFVPSLINWVVPAAIMSFGIEKGMPEVPAEAVVMKSGALTTVALLIGTIALAVCAHQFAHLPPVLGMMTGLGVLNVYSFFLTRAINHKASPPDDLGPDEIFADTEFQRPRTGLVRKREALDVLRQMERTEWDTLMFFYGVILCVGALGAFGYLAIMSEKMYGGLGPTWANVLVGILSAIIDNIPIMFAVLSMNPDMSHGQWLLVTLTAGVGGSLLSIGSAAGVALMGQARGVYTFFSHLKWAWAVALGYALSILAHLWLNRGHF